MIASAIVMAILLLSLAAGRIFEACRRQPHSSSAAPKTFHGRYALQQCDRAQTAAQVRAVRFFASLIVLAAALLTILLAVPGLLDTGGLAVVSAGGLVSAGAFFWACLKARRRYRLARRIYEDQVSTGQALAHLEGLGYDLFHDHEKECGDACCDHLVVGPKGVFAICVHTPDPKASVRPDGSMPLVTYDGRALFYKKSFDYKTITKAEHTASQLSERLSEVLDEPLAVRAVVAMNGWTVKRITSEGISVVNPNQFPSFFTHVSARPLSDDQMNRLKEHFLQQAQRQADTDLSSR